MSEITLDIADFHWVTQILDTMDSGLIVLDQDYKVCVWNSFMQSYSGILSQNILGECLFDHFEDLPRRWLETKLKTSADLETRSFSSWENRPYLFKFNNFSPVSNSSNLMFQDIVITPLRSLSGEISHIAIQINDVSETARNRIHLRETNQHLSEISRKDGLTGLFNRAFWEQSLKDEFAQLKVIEGASSLVIFDIDHFKKVNDTYGHQAGDQCLQSVASAINRLIKRPGDLVARYGGEEIVCLLPATDREGTGYLMEELRSTIKALAIPHAGATDKSILTISLGGASTKPGHNNRPKDLLRRADKRLYKAKKDGRDRALIL